MSQWFLSESEREHTNKNDAGGTFRRCKPFGQFEDASNGLVRFTIVLVLDGAGLEVHEESIHMLGYGLLVPALVNRGQMNKSYSRAGAAAQPK